MAHTFLSGSTNTAFIPPSMHFFTQAAPLPACFAPHMESEIHPVLVVEPAACATRTAMANIATSRKMFLFMKTSGSESLLAPMMLLLPGFFKCAFLTLQGRPATPTLTCERLAKRRRA